MNWMKMNFFKSLKIKDVYEILKDKRLRIEDLTLEVRENYVLLSSGSNYIYLNLRQLIALRDYLNDNLESK